MLKRNVGLVLGVLLLIVAPLWWYGSTHEFNGTDDQAQELVQRLQPGYQPWRDALYEPSERGERWLFALQAIIGAGGLTYCLWRLRARHKG